MDNASYYDFVLHDPLSSPFNVMGIDKLFGQVFRYYEEDDWIWLYLYFTLNPFSHDGVNWVTISSGNGFYPVRRQSLIWNNADLYQLETEE